jgi:hypothetical protein
VSLGRKPSAKLAHSETFPEDLTWLCILVSMLFMRQVCKIRLQHALYKLHNVQTKPDTPDWRVVAAPRGEQQWMAAQDL